MPKQQLLLRLPATVLAFRGYNVTNLGRTAELLAHPAYGPTVEKHLRAASVTAADVLRRPVDLVSRVRRGEETSLEAYGDAIALLLSVEAAQLELLGQFFEIDYRAARFSFGFSLGEVAAVVAGGVMDGHSVMRVILPLADET